ncbi:MAG TPA: AAA family ATPase [Bryobacteraceae bacterium]|nr:AAA family ATPase [Bryobacteraceae bacterium]
MAGGNFKRALLVCPDRSMADELGAVLSRETIVGEILDCKTYLASRPLAELLVSGPPDLCFLDVCSTPDQADRILAQLSDQPTKLPVIALLGRNEPERILRHLRRGAAGFLLRPFSKEQLKAALEKVAALFPQGRGVANGAGKVVSVVPAKGSCGATTIASNLACQAKQLGVSKVLLVDLDPLTSTLSFLWKLKPQYSFADALSHVNELDADLWKALVSGYRGLDVLPSPENPSDCAGDAPQLAELIEYCRGVYDLVFLDLGNPYGAWNLKAARVADEVLLVVTTDVPAVYGAQRTLACLERNGIARHRVRLLVNRFRKDYGLEPGDVESALGVEITQLLPYDREAIDSALIEARPVTGNSQFGKSLAELAARLADRETAARKPQAGGLLSLFSRA